MKEERGGGEKFLKPLIKNKSRFSLGVGTGGTSPSIILSGEKKKRAVGEKREEGK